MLAVVCALFGFSSVVKAAENLTLSGSLSVNAEKFFGSLDQLGTAPITLADVIPLYHINAEVPVDLQNIDLFF